MLYCILNLLITSIECLSLGFLEGKYCTCSYFKLTNNTCLFLGPSDSKYYTCSYFNLTDMFVFGPR